MKKIISILLLAINLPLFSDPNIIIERLDIRQGKINLLTKILSEATDLSVISTEEAGEIELPPYS